MVRDTEQRDTLDFVVAWLTTGAVALGFLGFLRFSLGDLSHSRVVSEVLIALGLLSILSATWTKDRFAHWIFAGLAMVCGYLMLWEQWAPAAPRLQLSKFALGFGLTAAVLAFLRPEHRLLRFARYYILSCFPVFLALLSVFTEGGLSPVQLIPAVFLLDFQLFRSVRNERPTTRVVLSVVLFVGSALKTLFLFIAAIS